MRCERRVEEPSEAVGRLETWTLRMFVSGDAPFKYCDLLQP